MRLTDSKVSRFVNDTGRDVFLRDEVLRGFSCKVTPANSKSFVAEGRVNGVFKKRRIGGFPAYSVAQAREAAREVLVKFSKGVDPLQERRLAAVRALSLGDAFEEYLAGRNLRPKTERDYRQAFKHVGSWVRRPLSEIRAAEISALNARLGRESGEAMAKKVMAVLKAVFNRAIAVHEYDIRNPVDVLRAAGESYGASVSIKGLEPHDLEVLLPALMRLGSEASRDSLVLQLFSGLRKTEANTLLWSDVDMERKAFTIRAEVAKNGKAHTLPMSSLIYRLFLQRVRSRDEADAFVFPSARGGCIKDNRRATQAIRAATGLDVTPHVLRAAFATSLARIGKGQDVIGALLNHSKGSVTAIYTRYSLEDLRESMQEVSEYIQIKASGSDESTEPYWFEWNYLGGTYNDEFVRRLTGEDRVFREYELAIQRGESELPPY